MLNSNIFTSNAQQEMVSGKKENNFTSDDCMTDEKRAVSHGLIR